MMSNAINEKGNNKEVGEGSSTMIGYRRIVIIQNNLSDFTEKFKYCDDFVLLFLTLFLRTRLHQNTWIQRTNFNTDLQLKGHFSSALELCLGFPM